MGAAFQIQDDLLNLAGDEDKYGKEIGGDIWEGKRTQMLMHTLNHCGPREKARLRRFLATPRPEREPRDVAWVYDLMHKYTAWNMPAAAPASWPKPPSRNSTWPTLACPTPPTRISSIILYLHD